MVLQVPLQGTASSGTTRKNTLFGFKKDLIKNKFMRRVYRAFRPVVKIVVKSLVIG